MNKQTRLLRAKKLKGLIEVVNYYRYRGVDGHGPITDKYGWPMSFSVLENIADAALGLVFSHDQRKK